jgi:hypothetical protein
MVFPRKEQPMAVILDIAGKPMSQRKRPMSQARAQDIRDLSKILLMLLLIVLGFFLFVPSRDAAEEIRVAATQKAQG